MSFRKSEQEHFQKDEILPLVPSSSKSEMGSQGCAESDTPAILDAKINKKSNVTTGKLVRRGRFPEGKFNHCLCVTQDTRKQKEMG